MITGYIDEHDNTLFVCPNCGFQKSFNALPFKNKNKKINIKCKCGVSTEMQIEFRKHFRKKVGIPGVCIIEKSKTKCDIILKDISLGGVGVEFFFIHKKNIEDIEPGDTILLEFKLDDKKDKTITKRCTVRIKMANTIGAEFNDENYSSAIGFYLMK